MYSAVVCLSLGIIQANPPDNAYPDMLLAKKNKIHVDVPLSVPSTLFGPYFVLCS
jgi:hypothetical protein